jgi:hypothetical protein
VRYFGGNPRLGQLFTTLMYSGTAVHAIVTPLVEVLTLVAVAALVLGRWPSPRRGDDVAVLALVAGMILVAAPAPASAAMFGYRPWTGNYVFGFLLHLLLLLPYRRHAAMPRQRGPLVAPLLFVGGIAAGLANEHTGLATIGLLVAALAWFRRRGERWAAWMLAGLAGLAIGYALLILAPGQDRRYSGLMDDTSIPDVVFDRGLGNLRIVGLFLVCAAALLPWWIAARLCRGARVGGRERWTIAALLAAGAVVVLTLLASPKQGWRLFFAPMVLWIAAVAIWIHLRVSGRALFRFALASSAVLAFQLGALLVVHHRVHPVTDLRYRRMAATPPGSAVVVPRLDVGRSPWFVGDDLRQPSQRLKVARRFRLRSIELDGDLDGDRTPPATVHGPAD